MPSMTHLTGYYLIAVTRARVTQITWSRGTSVIHSHLPSRAAETSCNP